MTQVTTPEPSWRRRQSTHPTPADLRLMPSRQSTVCPHDRRPGMTVCLHCRHAEREAARERRRAIFLRGGVLVGIIALLVGGAVAGAGARQDHGPAEAPHSTPTAAKRTRHLDSLDVAAAPRSARSDSTTHPGVPAAASATAADSQPSVAQAGAPASPAVATPAPSSTSAAPRPATIAVVAPVIPDGRTELGDSLFAIRTGDTVQVHFDTQAARTRRRDKFEHIVRLTLPRVYGGIADSALAAVPDGALTRDGDLLSELPTRGVRVAVPGGRTLVLWPETRPGRDGPLVVSYRAVVPR